MKEKCTAVGKSSFLCGGFSFLSECYRDELYSCYETVCKVES